MSGFGGFGTGSPSGGLFGAKPPEQTSTGFTLPAATTVTTTATGFNFGTPTFGSGGLFGAQPQQTPTFGTGFGAKPATTTTAGLGFSFGASTTTPAFGAQPASTNIPTFGTTNTAAPTFGSFGTTTAPTFGTTAAPTFGAPAAPTFGATTAPTFGTTTASTFGTTPLTLNPPKTTATTGFTLPLSTAATTTAAPTFSFGVTPAATTSAPLTFGLAAATTTGTTSTPTLTFGVTSVSTAASTTAATTQATGFTFTQPATAATTTTTTSLSFGLPKTTGGLTFGTGTATLAATTTSAAPKFSFGTTTTTTLGSGGGLFGAAKTTEGASLTTATTTTASAGLGGIDYTQTTQGLSGAGTVEPKHAKDHPLPEPILQTLNEFQNFTKQQKSISVEISHGSSKPLKKVQEDTEAMESLLTMITSGLTRNAIAVDKLKTETAQGLHQAEMAQRNHETPPGLEYDNSASADYFNDLVTKFETDTVRLRVQIEASEKHLKSLTQGSTISPQELTLAMRRLHETLIVLAARVQALHTTVQSQKEQYKNLRRVYFKDDSNMFENGPESSLVKKQTIYSLRSLTGPTPFSETPGVPPLHVDGLAMLASSAGTPMPATSTNPSWLSPLQGSATTPSLLPSSNLLGSFQPLDLPGFQLAKPPTGNKRTRH